jgi:hypothetical protein
MPSGSEVWHSHAGRWHFYALQGRYDRAMLHGGTCNAIQHKGVTEPRRTVWPCPLAWWYGEAMTSGDKFKPLGVGVTEPCCTVVRGSPCWRGACGLVWRSLVLRNHGVPQPQKTTPAGSISGAYALMVYTRYCQKRSIESLAQVGMWLLMAVESLLLVTE